MACTRAERVGHAMQAGVPWCHVIKSSPSSLTAGSIDQMSLDLSAAWMQEPRQHLAAELSAGVRLLRRYPPFSSWPQTWRPRAPCCPRAQQQGLSGPSPAEPCPRPARATGPCCPSSPCTLARTPCSLCSCMQACACPVSQLPAVLMQLLLASDPHTAAQAHMGHAVS